MNRSPASYARATGEFPAVPASLAGLPAISVPSGLTRGGLPLGIQVLGPAFAEEKVFAAARAFEIGAEFPDGLPGLEG